MTGVIAVDLFTFAVAVIVVLLIHIPRPAQTDESGAPCRDRCSKKPFGGLRFLWKWRTLFGLTLQLALVNFLFAGAIDPVHALSAGAHRQRGDLRHADGRLQRSARSPAASIIGIWGGTKPRIHTILPGIIIGGALPRLGGGCPDADPARRGALFLMHVPDPDGQRGGDVA